MTAVFDASFLFRGVVRTQLLPAARLEFDRLVTRHEELVAPVLLKIEVLSGLRRLERVGALAAGELEYTMAIIRNLSIDYRWDDAWLTRGLAIARAIGASRIYDSVYLACAEAFNATLYTCDATFVRGFAEAPSNIRLVV